MDRHNAKRRAAAAAVPVLPDDAIVDILARLPAKSLCRSKCVSKPWRDLIAGRLRCTSLPQTLAGFFCTGSDRVVGRFVNPSGRSVPFVSFAFLGKQPKIQQFGMISSCNGLVLFGHRQFGDSYDTLGYIVCNPATEQWVAVPSSGEDEGNCKFTYMMFDPAASPHFQLVEFWTPTYEASVVEEVHTYSSETGVWSKRTSTWDDDEYVAFAARGAFVNGMLHLSATRFFKSGKHRELIVAVDGEGKNHTVISGPKEDCNVAFVTESQGCLHFVDEHKDIARGMAELSIWVLQDYYAEEWVLKHSVSFLHLFGRMDCQAHFDYNVIAIHPDRNLIFFFQHWDLKLKSYDMDSQEVCIIRSLGVGRQTISPYVPYFAESPALASKH
ncbi:hypothetical protein HU200_060957 [Digitaria exilis]|uniref:F-box domain-containing protein n=1 Tax=Digitaria exilis TaxID=1010633 RepID=A0A835DYC1_9POAL|nr:hypothetical protein HU200_060957 [Digitaria exilis]